jgi:hypothetical protein
MVEEEPGFDRPFSIDWDKLAS